MQVPMKKHRTEADTIELRFLGPQEKRKQAIRVLDSMGFVDVSDSVPWQVCFSYADEQLPSISLAGAREKEGLTQRELSRLTGIPQRRISEMENGRRPIKKETAKKLGKTLNISYKVFL